MIELASFEILGVPAPQGSKTRMPNGHMIEGSSDTGRAKHKAWRQSVAATARDITRHDDISAPFDGALQVSIEFRLPMPASRPAAARRAGRWPHTVKPDKDKLLRCTFDGLKDGGLVRDDARFFALEVEAWEVIGWTGAVITIRQFEGPTT